MESVDSSPSSTASSTRNKTAKTPLLTPCRRLGLARKSPASSSVWHASKLSPCTAESAFRSPSEVPHESNFRSPPENDCGRNQVTPVRSQPRTMRIRQLSKRLKTNNLTVLHAVTEGNEVSNCDPDTSEVVSGCPQNNGDTLLSEKDLEYEIVLPAEDITKEMLNEVKLRIKKKEEKLKDLKLVQLYKRKHDINTLRQLIQKWLEGCQTALQELLSLLLEQGHKLNMEELLRQLNIPQELVKYKVDTEDFE